MSPLDRLSDADLEQLSRWLDGELSVAEAAALAARVQQEPALAAAWHSMAALPADLAALPTEAPVPPALLQQVLADRRPRAPAKTGRWKPGNVLLGLILGAATTLLVLRPKPAPRLDLLQGAQLVEGNAVLMAGDTRVTIEGRARISVEPAAALGRESERTPHPEEPMQLPSLAAGALGGALITVAVYEGRATLDPPGGPSQRLSAGQSAQVGGSPDRLDPPAPPATPDRARGPASPPPADLPAALARIDALAREIAALELERDLQAGALVQVEGQPQPWPEGLHPAYAEPAFTRTVQAALAADPELELLGVDCAEYPCIAMARSFGDPDGAGPKALGERLGEQLAAQGLADPGLGLWVSREQGPEGTEPLTLVGLTLSDPAQTPPDNRTRTDWRIGEWTAQIADELAEGPPPAAYPDP